MDVRPAALALILAGCAASAEQAGTGPPTPAAAPPAPAFDPAGEDVWWAGSAELDALVRAAHGCGLPAAEISYWSFPEQDRHMIPGVAIPNSPAEAHRCVIDWIKAHPEWGFSADG